MTYTIEVGPHSADKNHRVMTGGTLTVDKTIHDDEGVSFHTYSIEMYRDASHKNFHRGIHTSEHLLAYKKDTGSMRDSLEEISSHEIDGKVILDISPYKTGKESFGFRVTSMIQLDVEVVRQVVDMSVSRAIEFLKTGKVENEEDYEGIPFARDIACGQFDFHSKEKALLDLEAFDSSKAEIFYKKVSSSHTSAYVCDLRLLKPKINGKDDMLTLSPKLSYFISETIEKELPKKLEAIVLVGTFGCMTGMYLCVSSELGDGSDIGEIHSQILEIIENIDQTQLSESEKNQISLIVHNYNFHK